MSLPHQFTMPNESYYQMYNKGTEAGGGSGYQTQRICSSAQTQPDPKQQQQSVQPGGIHMSFQTRPTGPMYQRAPTARLGAPRQQGPILGQSIGNSNMYPPSIVMHPFQTAVIVPSVGGGRHQTHGGGQGGGSGGGPANLGPYFQSGPHSQQQILFPHHTLTTPPNFYNPPYVYSAGHAIRNNSYPNQNQGPHPGAPAPQPPQHQPQQYMVDGGVRGSSGSMGSGGIPGPQVAALISQPHFPPQPPPQAQPPQQRLTRRKNALPILNPNTGENIMDEFYSENNSRESSGIVTPYSFSHPDNSQEIVTEFATKVAAMAAPTEVVMQAPLPPQAVNGPSVSPSSPPPPAAAPLTASPSSPPPPPLAAAAPEVQRPPSPLSPPPPLQHQQQPPQQHQPPAPLPPVLQAPPHPQTTIPTVSAKTDSPHVEIHPRPKGPTHSPGRKPTPIPSSVLPVLDLKKKEKKVTGIGGGVGTSLPPHREEPAAEEVRKSTFSESISIGNIMAPLMVSSPVLASTPVVQPIAEEAPEATKEPEARPQPEVTVQQPPPLQTLGKQQEKNEPQPSYDRGKTITKKPGRGKKGGSGKEAAKRWQEKEGGGSDMDAFVSAGPPAAARSPPPPLLAASPSPPPPTAALTSGDAAAPAVPPPSAVEERQPSPRPAPTPSPPSQEPSIPPRPVVEEKLLDEAEPMDEGEEEEETDTGAADNIAAINEENTKHSAPSPTPTGEEATDNNVTINGNEPTPVTETPKPTLKYTYKEGQWSPLNPTGKKVYDREFLMILKSDPLSNKRPEIEDCDILKTDSTNNNNISANNNNRRLHGSSSMNMMNREIYSFAPNFTRSSSSQRGGMMNKRGSQQGGRPSRDGRSKGGYTSSQQYKDAVDGELHWAAKGSSWKPERCKTPPKATEDDLKTANLYKKVRGILNKLTPQKFETLMEQILELPIDTSERLRGVVGLVIDKAVDEPSFSRAYAKLCCNLNKLAIKKSEGESQQQQKAADLTFKKILLNKCQLMFEKKKKEEKEGEEGKKSEEERIAELQKQIEEENNKDKKKEYQHALEEEERKIRVKYVGLARFIGELFKLNMLTTKIMFGCISTLLEKIEEESLECLCKLLSTVGKELEAQAKVSDQIKELDSCFLRMKKLSQKTSNSKVSSRVRFMLQDVIELRLNKWVPRREDNNPKTMDQIQRDAEREATIESAMLQSSNTPRSKHSDRNDDRRQRGQRTVGNADPEGWISASQKFRTYNNTFEAAKLQQLKGSSSEASSQNLGSHNYFSKWSTGSNAGPKTLPSSGDHRKGHDLPTVNKFSILSEKQSIPPLISRKATPSASMEKDRAVQSLKDALAADKARNQGSNPPSRDSSRGRKPTTPTPSPASSEPPEVMGPPSAPPPLASRKLLDPDLAKKKSRVLFEEWLANHNLEESVESIVEAFPAPIQFVQSILERVIEGKEAQRIACSELLVPLLARKVIATSDLAKELGELIENGEDLMIDLPFVWKYLGEIIAPIMAKSEFSFADLKSACQNVRTSYLSTTLAEIISRLLKEKGPVFIKNQWESSNVKFSDFFPEEDVENFIKKNNFAFIIGEGEVESPKEPVMSMTEVEDKIVNFLLQDGDKVFDHICEWVKANVGKSQDVDFIKTLVRGVIKVSTRNGKIVSATLNKHSTLIKKFVDADETRELACLNGIMNLVVNEMLSPSGLLVEIFQILYEDNIISHEGFLKWKNHEVGAPGKGVATASLASFFVSLAEQEETDDDST